MPPWTLNAAALVTLPPSPVTCSTVAPLPTVMVPVQFWSASNCSVADPLIVMPARLLRAFGLRTSVRSVPPTVSVLPPPLTELPRFSRPAVVPTVAFAASVTGPTQPSVALLLLTIAPACPAAPVPAMVNERVRTSWPFVSKVPPELTATSPARSVAAVIFRMPAATVVPPL